MAETGLKRIQAPALNSGYGANVQTTFDNIDANFGVLANTEIQKGDTGKSLLSLNVPWNVLLETPGETPSHEFEGYIFDDQTSNLIDAFEVITDDSTDVNSAIYQLYNSNSSVLVCFEEPANSLTHVSIKSTMPYVFIDANYRDTDNIISPTNPRTTDMSCSISFDGTDWVCNQNMPTLYYDQDKGTFYWIIDGNKTSIIAQGPKGEDGTSGDILIGKFNSGDYDTPTGQLVTISKVFNGSDVNQPWVDPADYSPAIKSGTTIILIPDPAIPDPNDQNGNKIYFISKTSVATVGDTTTYQALLSSNNIAYAYMNDQTFAASMEHIKEIDLSDPDLNQLLKGYIIKDLSGDGGYMLYATKDPNQSDGACILHLEHVDDVDDPIDGSSDLTNRSFVIGKQYITGYRSHADGQYARADGEYTFADGDYSHATNYRTLASGEASHAEGRYTVAKGDGSHAEGYSESYGVHYTDPTYNPIQSIGIGSHAEGFADGEDNQNYSDKGKILAIGDGSHVEGYSSKGYYSHPYPTQRKCIIANGKGSHAEGMGTTAYGNYSHAEGEGTVNPQSYDIQLVEENTREYSIDRITDLNVGDHVIFKGGNAAVDGRVAKITQITNNPSIYLDNEIGYIGPHYTIYVIKGVASGEASHTEGYKTTAEGDYSHAEGENTIASGEVSHAEGYGAIASGNYSHVEGCYTIASAPYSHASGYKTTTGGDPGTTYFGNYRHGVFACGRYNKPGWVLIIEYEDNSSREASCFTIGDEEPNLPGWEETVGTHVYVAPILFSVGAGDSDFDEKNAFFITAGGPPKHGDTEDKYSREPRVWVYAGTITSEHAQSINNTLTTILGSTHPTISEGPYYSEIALKGIS